MSEFSLSFHEDTLFNIDHDNRKHLSRNVIPERVGDNIVYEGNIPIEQFYDETFQKSYEEFLQKQIKSGHGSRFKDAPGKYYDYVVDTQIKKDAEYKEALARGVHKKDLNGKNSHAKVAKQIIVQIGNTDDVTNENLTAEEQNEIKSQMVLALKKYMETFQRENPNFRIVNAVIHVDEIGETPHLHLTYVPVAEQKRGQAIANNQEGALKAMGFTSDKKAKEDGTFETALTKWQMKERDRAIEIAAEFGLDAGYTKGNKGKSVDLTTYRETKQAEREAKTLELLSQHNEHTLDAQSERIDQNDDTIAEQSETISNNDMIITEQNKKVKELSEEISELSKTYETTEEQVKQKTEELSKAVEEWPSRLQQSFQIAQRKLENELIPPVPPSDTYERVQKSAGFGKPKKTFVMVPEEQYAVLERRNGLRPEYVKGFIKDTIKPVAEAIMNLPVVQNLVVALQGMQAKVDSLTKKLKASNQERDTLRREVERLREEKSTLEQQAKVADKVLFKKLGLPREAVQKMQAEAAREVLKEAAVSQRPTRQTSIEDDVLR